MNESSSPAFDVVSALGFGHSNRCVVASHCCFNLHFANDMCCGVSFHMLLCHLYFFSSEVSVERELGPTLRILQFREETETYANSVRCSNCNNRMQARSEGS